MKVSVDRVFSSFIFYAVPFHTLALTKCGAWIPVQNGQGESVLRAGTKLMSLSSEEPPKWVAFLCFPHNEPKQGHPQHKRLPTMTALTGCPFKDMHTQAKPATLWQALGRPSWRELGLGIGTLVPCLGSVLRSFGRCRSGLSQRPGR